MQEEIKPDNLEQNIEPSVQTNEASPAVNDLAPGVDPAEYDRLQTKIASLKNQLDSLEQEQQAKAEAAAPLKTIFAWEAPDRVYSEKSRLWFTAVSLGFMLCIAFAALTQETLLLIAIVALMVVIYLSNVIKPLLVRHEITNKGLYTQNQLHVWNDISGFWIGKRGEHYLLLVDLVPEKKPDRMLLLLGTTDPLAVIEPLIRHIPYMTRNQVSEDFINTFTLGTYLPISTWVNQEK